MPGRWSVGAGNRTVKKGKEKWETKEKGRAKTSRKANHKIVGRWVSKMRKQGS